MKIKLMSALLISLTTTLAFAARKPTDKVYFVKPEQVSFEVVDVAGPINEMHVKLNGRFVFYRNCGEVSPCRKWVARLNQKMLDASINNHFVIVNVTQEYVAETKYSFNTPIETMAADPKPELGPE